MAKLVDTTEAVQRGPRMQQALEAGLAHARDEQRVFDLICAVIVGAGGHTWAWVGKAEHDERRTVHPIAFAGEGAETITATEVRWSVSEHGSGPTGIAIRTRVPCVMARIGADPRVTAWREIAVRHRFTVALSLPLVIDGELFGAVTVYARDPGAFGADEVALLVDLVRDAALAAAKLRARDIAARTETALARLASEQQLRLIAEHIADLLWVVDPIAGRVVYVSRAFEAMWGKPLPSHDMRMHDWLATVDPGDVDDVLRAFSTCVEQGQRVEIACRIRRPDGTVRQVRANASPVLDAAGRVIRVVGVTRDVTTQAAAESALDKSGVRQRGDRRDPEVGATDPGLTQRVSQRRRPARARGGG